MIIGAYLIASAVKNSGLGERIAYWFIIHTMRSFKSVIVSIFGLTFILSLIIPHPFPRAFLIMSVIAEVVVNSGMSKRDAAYVGFAVFAASVPVSMIFLTGDSTINPLVAQYAGVELKWTGWLWYMGLPCAIASVLICAAMLIVFKPSQNVIIDKTAAIEKLRNLGKLSRREINALIWLGAAVALWTTDSIHGVDIGWVTLLIAMLMGMPRFGGLLTAKSWGDVPLHVLLFVSAAMAIGRVGAVTGMNEWIAHTLMPSAVPVNPFLFAGLVTTISVVIHMLLGSVISVMGVAIPTVLTYASSNGMNPLVPAFIVYSAIVLHYALPFQNMNILVGVGEENGAYSEREPLRFTIPLLLIAYFVIVLLEIPWWIFVGLL
jgi:di/tricarboxylate transporter